MSAVWRYCKLTDAKSKTAECNACDYFEGWKQRWEVQHYKLNKTPWTKHHGRLHEEFLQATKAKRKREPQQQTLKETLQKHEKFPAEIDKAKRVTDPVIEFIVLDDQVSVQQKKSLTR